MKGVLSILYFTGAILLSCNSGTVKISGVQNSIILNDTIQYHHVRINPADSSILPWFSDDISLSYDTCLKLVWNFWKNLPADSNGLKYYMNHQVWKPEHDMRGLGGDQFSMALSSWRMLYAYTGDPTLIDDMKYIADNYLERSLSGSSDKWPFIPYPYNTVIHSGIYDGDMRNGKGITQPDKAGNFGYELVNLYKITGERKYLDAAINIAATLLKHLTPGDSLRSPLPFRVNTKTGESGLLFNNNGSGKKVENALYTSNWTCTMDLFKELEKLNSESTGQYIKGFKLILDWMKKYPLKTNKWGPFFEDIPGWSDTQTNAISMAMFILDHRDLFPGWQKEVRSIFDWTYRELANHEYEKYHVTVMNEQTVYRVPGNSHSSRQASIELMYTVASGDNTYKNNAIRVLNWATYTVASDGRNRYIRDDIWLTDGYGDYVRHYLRAMAACPELAPQGQDHLLRTSSVISNISYKRNSIEYITYDNDSEELLRLKSKPISVKCAENVLHEINGPLTDSGWTWDQKGGLLKIRHTANNKISVLFN